MDQRPLVLTIGTFDLFHYGHLNLLQKASLLGELIVGVNSDNFVKKYKGKPPIMDENERMKTINMVGVPTALNKSAGRELIDEIKPDILAIGTDWFRKDYLKQIDVTIDYLEENDISLIFIPYTKSISSTEIKKRVGLH